MAESSSRATGTITLLLQRSAQGDLAARDAVWSLAQRELRTLAQSRLSAESSAPTWQPTELVNEVWLKLSDLRLDLRNRAHFLATAATAMRRVLIDHARGKRRDKRGNAVRAVTLDPGLAGASGTPSVDILDLDRALVELEGLDPRKSRAIELSYFGGMTDLEIAQALGVSEPTVKRDLRSARAWLATALNTPS